MENLELKNVLEELLLPINEKLSNLKKDISSQIELLLCKADFERQIATLQDTFTKEIIIRDQKIERLEETILNQQACIENINGKLSDMSGKIKRESSAHDKPKKDLELGIIGDSLVKWIDPKRVCPGTETELVCLPGARVGDIKKSVKRFAANFQPKNLILCTGTNHIPDESTHAINHKVKMLLEYTKALLPNTKIFLNSILPKYEETFSPGILELNKFLFVTCKKVGVDFIYNKQFWTGNGHNINFSLLAKDKLHLSKKGVATMGSN